jgi:hypothetical protein
MNSKKGSWNARSAKRQKSRYWWEALSFAVRRGSIAHDNGRSRTALIAESGIDNIVEDRAK